MTTSEANMPWLRNVTPGTAFYFGGHRWTVLDHTPEGGTLAIMADFLSYEVFDEQNCNDWRVSSLRAYLNDKENGFYGKLANYLIDPLSNKGYSDLRGLFMPITSNLTAADGMTDYGTSEDYISLLSCDQYYKYYKLIPHIERGYWTLTPLTCSEDSAGHTRVIGASGALSTPYGFNAIRGVRPLCKLNSDMLVSIKKPEEEIDIHKSITCAECGAKLGSKYHMVDLAKDS